MSLNGEQLVQRQFHANDAQVATLAGVMGVEMLVSHLGADRMERWELTATDTWTRVMVRDA